MVWSLAESKKPVWQLDTNHHEESKLLRVKRGKRMVGGLEGELLVNMCTFTCLY